MKIVGRSKDMIIRGGENVYPREIEEFLYSHDAISDAAVYGVPDPRYGEAVMVSVILREGASLTEDELREYCDGKIAHYKVPRYVTFVDEFPMTVTGKVQKYKMRDAAVEELGLAEAAARVALGTLGGMPALLRRGLRGGRRAAAALPRRARGARRPRSREARRAAARADARARGPLRLDRARRVRHRRRAADVHARGVGHARPRPRPARARARRLPARRLRRAADRRGRRRARTG